MKSFSSSYWAVFRIEEEHDDEAEAERSARFSQRSDT
jgi:hypothetical protein